MIGKVLRGRRVQGLIRYLYGPGRYNEHRDPHIVAGFDAPSSLEPEFTADGKRDFRRLDSLMLQPLALLGERNHPKPVWHLSLRAHPDDPVLTDAQWADIAAEVMHRTGLAPFGDSEAIRWFALRHADDHIHIVATLARQDGTCPKVWNDGYRVREACRVIEQRYGLHRTAPADRTPARRAKRAESEKAHRNKRPEPARNALRRRVVTAAASARSEPEFFELLEAEGVLVRKRLSALVPDQVTGYAVALPDDLNSHGEPVWYGGGKLAADLTLPKLRHRWTDQGGSAGRLPPVGLLSEPSVRGLLRDAVRAAAARSQNAEEFLERLEAQGVKVKWRFSQRNPDEVTGYAVALPGGTGDREPVWYPGGRLGSDLSLSRLERQWAGQAGPADDAADLTVEERRAIYQDAARAAEYATAQIRRHVATDPFVVRDACWAASDALHVAARATGNVHLRRAADAYDRAARPPYGRLPQPTYAGTGLRTAARLLALLRPVGEPPSGMALQLVTSLVVLVESIAQLYRTQGRDAQEAAARKARMHLEKAAPASKSWDGLLTQPDAKPSPVDLALSAFPKPWARSHAGDGVGASVRQHSRTVKRPPDRGPTP